MSDIELIVKMPEDEYKIIKESGSRPMLWVEHLIKAGTLIPKGHGKIVDIGKIDEDRIDGDNPVIQLTINGECIEAVSLDYLDDLPAIIEADEDVTVKKKK